MWSGKRWLLCGVAMKSWDMLTQPSGYSIQCPWQPDGTHLFTCQSVDLLQVYKNIPTVRVLHWRRRYRRLQHFSPIQSSQSAVIARPRLPLPSSPLCLFGEGLFWAHLPNKDWRRLVFICVFIIYWDGVAWKFWFQVYKDQGPFTSQYCWYMPVLSLFMAHPNHSGTNSYNIISRFCYLIWRVFTDCD